MSRCHDLVAELSLNGKCGGGITDRGVLGAVALTRLSILDKLEGEAMPVPILP